MCLWREPSIVRYVIGLSERGGCKHSYRGGVHVKTIGSMCGHRLALPLSMRGLHSCGLELAEWAVQRHKSPPARPLSYIDHLFPVLQQSCKADSLAPCTARLLCLSPFPSCCCCDHGCHACKQMHLVRRAYLRYPFSPALPRPALHLPGYASIVPCERSLHVVFQLCAQGPAKPNTCVHCKVAPMLAHLSRCCAPHMYAPSSFSHLVTLPALRRLAS